MVVVYIRNSLLSVVRQITSSRQSPRMSALSAGVAFVPLFDAQPSAVSIMVSAPSAQFHLKIVLRSSNSLSVSPSQKTPKLQERGSWSDIFSPLALNNPVTPAPLTQHSKPG